MAAFDPKLWKDRSWERFQNAAKVGKDPARVAWRWAEDCRCIEALRVVVEWCEARSLTVTFCKRAGGIYYTDDKEIKVSGRASPKHQLHILLHECGHHLIGEKQKHERYGLGYGNQDPDVKRSLQHRIDIVDEEFEAWHRGWKLGLRLGALLPAHKPEFDRTKAKMLRSYLSWAVKAPGYERYDDPNGDEEDTSGG